MIRKAHPEEIIRAALAMSYAPSAQVKGIVLAEKRAMKACVLYDYWTYNSANVHIYSTDASSLLNPRFVEEMFRYPYEQLGLGILMAVTPADSTASLAFSKALGFREIMRIKDGWKVGIDMVVKEMRREECRYLTQKVAA